MPPYLQVRPIWSFAPRGQLLSTLTPFRIQLDVVELRPRNGLPAQQRWRPERRARSREIERSERAGHGRTARLVPRDILDDQLIAIAAPRRTDLSANRDALPV